MSNTKPPASKNNSAKPPVVPVAVTESVKNAAQNLKEVGAKEKKQQGQNGGRHTAAHRQAVRRMKKAMTKMNSALKKCNKKRMTRRRKH
jgi:hypothetical protein